MVGIRDKEKNPERLRIGYNQNHCVHQDENNTGIIKDQEIKKIKAKRDHQFQETSAETGEDPGITTPKQDQVLETARPVQDKSLMY